MSIDLLPILFVGCADGLQTACGISRGFPVYAVRDWSELSVKEVRRRHRAPLTE